MRFDGSSLRQASESPLPFRDREVTLLTIRADGRLQQEHTLGGKRELVAQLGPDDALLAAWTGRYRTDIFWVDDLASVTAALTDVPS